MFLPALQMLITANPSLRFAKRGADEVVVRTISSPPFAQAYKSRFPLGVASFATSLLKASLLTCKTYTTTPLKCKTGALLLTMT